MAVESKTSVKAHFIAYNFPSAADFGSLVDSYTDASDALEAVATAARTGSKGLVYVSGASAVSFYSAGSVGLRIANTATTAAALGAIGGTTVGQAVFIATTTAAAQQAQGGGAVGRQLFETTTTAAANAVLGVVSAATTAEVAAGTVSAKYVSPVTFVESLLAPKALATVEATSIGRQVILQGYNVSTVSAMGGGVYNVVFASPMASAGYTVIVAATQGGAYRICTPNDATNVSAGGFGFLAVDTSYAGANLTSNSRANIVVFGTKA